MALTSESCLSGAELDLFSIQEQAGGGLVFWHPKGGRIRNIIETFWKDIHMKQGYELVYSPHIANVALWKQSGHFEFYADGMFDQVHESCLLYVMSHVYDAFEFYET